jgi:hypothetical protein
MCGNPDLKGYAWYVLPGKWILTIKYRISMIQLTEHKKKKNNKKEGPSVDNSNLLRIGNKIIMGGQGKEDPGWRWGRRGRKGGEAQRVMRMI